MRSGKLKNSDFGFWDRFDFGFGIADFGLSRFGILDFGFNSKAQGA
jgi:hypothetical protein